MMSSEIDKLKVGGTGQQTRLMDLTLLGDDARGSSTWQWEMGARIQYEEGYPA